MPGMHRLIALVAVAAGVLAAAPAADAAKRRVPRGFYGVMWDRAAHRLSDLDRELQWATMTESGVESVRVVFPWAAMQPVAGEAPTYQATDTTVALAARHGIRLLPMVFDTPSWASRFPERDASPPERVSDYTAFLRQLVLRYGPAGSFWDERPDLPRVPVRDWQIWNEPHFDVYWYAPGAKDAWARDYVALLRASKKAIEDIDPGARIVIGGLADASWRVLSTAYRAGARGAFDTAAINIFTAKPGFVMAAARLTRRVMRRHRDARKHVWVTETTFPAGKGLVPRPPLSWQQDWYTTDAGMATRLRALYSLAARNVNRLLLRRIYWYTWASSYRGTDDLFDYAGLVRFSDGELERRPALDAYVESARRHEGCIKTASGACATP
jgi:hypothetical protein